MYSFRKQSIFTTTTHKFLLIFCILIPSYYLPLSSSLAVEKVELENSPNLNRSLEKGYVKARRLPSTEGENQWEDNNVDNNLDLEDEGAKVLLNPKLKGLLPFVQSGECKRGWTYKILRGQDLKNYGHELECIFFSGITPRKIPHGPLYGTVLSILDVKEFAIVNLVWWGKFINEVECSTSTKNGRFSGRKKIVHIGWNNYQDHILNPFSARLGPSLERLAPGEFWDGRDNLIIDYTTDFSKLCPNFGQLRKSQGLHGVLPARNPFPINQFVDVSRLVGRQSDGGGIYLGKMYVRHPPRHWSSTVIYFYFLNYDLGVNPDFKRGQALPPLETSFSYTIPSLLSATN